MDKFTIKPVFDPSSVLIFVINRPFALFKQRIVYFAFRCSNKHYVLLMIAVSALLAGMVIKKVFEALLSAPKFSTATDLFALDAL